MSYSVSDKQERLVGMINWQYYPKSDPAPVLALAVIEGFENVYKNIDPTHHDLPSNDVLAHVREGLVSSGCRVETGKREKEKIRVPVLFGRNGRFEKSFEADAYHEEEGFVVEVEAGRGVTNYQFFKEFFQACMMSGVRHLAVAVRNTYRSSPDFEKVCRFWTRCMPATKLACLWRAL